MMTLYLSVIACISSWASLILSSGVRMVLGGGKLGERDAGVSSVSLILLILFLAII